MDSVKIRKGPACIRGVFFRSALLLLLLCPCFCSGCAAGNKEPVSKTGFYFDTVITVTLYDGKESLIDDCFSLAEKYEKMFSATIEDSEVSKINGAGGTSVAVSDEMLELLQKGLEYCELSEGGFDITIGELSSLWDFSNEDGQVPDTAAIRSALPAVGYQNIVIEGNEVRLLNPDTSIDLGGIAKGYIADRMKEFLVKNGVTSGMINLGGNVLCIGEKMDGEPYRIGIQMPFDEHGATAAVVEVTNETVVTSGVYERYMRIDDKLYHHILNPATGYPYDNHLLGVSVICENSVDGDGLSTSCFSLGLEKGMRLIESLPDTEAVFITDDYELHYSSGIGDTVTVEAIATVSKEALSPLPDTETLSSLPDPESVMEQERERILQLSAGELAASGKIEPEQINHFFFASALNEEILARIDGKSYTENENVLPSQLSYLKMLYYGFDGNTYVGEMIVSQNLEAEVLEIFQTLYENEYPIEKMVLVDEYGADDGKSMEDNNTSAFNYRTIAGSGKLSNHSYGTAIDLNPKYNPYVKTAPDGSVICQPESGRKYADRSKDFAYKIDENDLAYRLFTEAGFSWGGHWNSVKDYQHFEK